MHNFQISSLYLKQLVNSYDIILVQEHMLRENDIYSLISSASDFNLFFVPAKMNNIVGYPSGGLGIFVKKNLMPSINR